MLSFFVDFVANVVVTTPFHAVVISAMESMVPEFVLREIAGRSATIGSFHEREA